MYVIQGQADNDEGTTVWSVGIVEDYALAAYIQDALNETQHEALESDDENIVSEILKTAKYRDEYGEDWIKAGNRVEYSISPASFMSWE